MWRSSDATARLLDTHSRSLPRSKLSRASKQGSEEEKPQDTSHSLVLLGRSMKETTNMPTTPSDQKQETDDGRITREVLITPGREEKKKNLHSLKNEFYFRYF